LVKEISPATVTKSPVTGESAEETVKTIARGMPGEAGEPVDDLVFFDTKPWVHRAPGIPCALC